MYDIDKIHKKNPKLDTWKHELIWNILGKYRVLLRVNSNKYEVIPFTLSLKTSTDKLYYIFTYIERVLQNYLFYEKRGILESIYLIEKHLQRIL